MIFDLNGELDFKQIMPLFSLTSVVVQVRVGKEFQDMRQNEWEIKFIRMGDAARTAGQLRGEPTLNRGPQSTFILRVQGVGQGSCGSFANWMRHVYWVGGRVRQIPSPYGVEEETGYTAQEDMKSINSYNLNYITTLLQYNVM